MDPAVVGSAQFGQIFKTALPGNYQNVPEQVFSQPLVYTLSDGVQYVFLATTQNNIYKMNAKTGLIVAQRNLHVPFLTSDLDGCVDINPFIGVTATGVIDPDTDVWYLTSKTYINQAVNGPKGKPNGRYYFHAINTNDLSEKPNFPVDLEGTVARNNPVRIFGGGIHHQRPALLHYGQYVYAGFASHCVQYNFTGWIMGFNKDTGEIAEHFATEGANVANTVPGGGVWMSGGGLASDGAGSMFFATGNGYASQLNGIPVSGRQPPTSLEEAAVHMTIGDNGQLTVVDFFMPWEKVQLDGADKDLGTSPLELLPSQFSCGSVKRMGVVTGKSGKTYWIDLDNMGGYQNGPNKLDAVIQVYQNENSVYAGAGVYPLEGGYIYINVIQYKTHVFKFSCTNGSPLFTKVADSPEVNAYILGVGHGTVTSLNGQPGTGLVWTSDVEGANLRIYDAVPVDGVLNLINEFNVLGTTKFTRPVFGDGIVYIGTTLGFFYAFGAPVNLPFNCSSPYEFGTLDLQDTSSPKIITCKASINTQVTGVGIVGNPNFKVLGVPNLPVTIAAGGVFSFEATFAPGQVGPLSSNAIINTTNAVGGFSIETPVRLEGTGQSTNALLSINPNTVSYNGVVTGQQDGGVNQSIIIINQGNSPLSVTSVLFSTSSETGPWITPTTTPSGPQIGPFTFIGLPSTIAGNDQDTVTINFNPTSPANYAAFVQVNSNGGSKVFDVLGTAGTNPVALVEFQTLDGTDWVEYQRGIPFTFGNVTENTSRNLKMRLTNSGPSSAVRLSVTVSKPPFGVPGIIGAVNQVDLAEGTTLGPGESATATLFCSAPKSQIDVDSYTGTAQWTLNTGDPAFGKQVIEFFCEAVAEQAPPLSPSGSAIYRYEGCFLENNPGRQLSLQLYASDTNNDETPKKQVDEANCNFACSGNINEICGGNGVDALGAYISLFADSTRFDGNTTAPAGPFVNSGVDGYGSLGCYTEGTDGRALGVGMGLSTATVANCLVACYSYRYAGVEFAAECYCGNNLGIGSVPTAIDECDMACSGNGSEYCGAANRLNVYEHNVTDTGDTAVPPGGPSILSTVGSYSYVDCHTEVDGRALTGKAIAAPDMTVQYCLGNCSSFAYFALEYSDECYCGNTLAPTSVPASDGRCSMTCAGNATEICGGPNGLTLYFSNTTDASTPPTDPPTDPQPTGPPGVSFVENLGNFTYQGCKTEVDGRALTGKAIAAPDMTIEYCMSNCTGFSYFALEYSDECYCSNTIAAGSVSATDGRCSMKCAGNSTEICGGPNGLSLYFDSSFQAPSSPVTPAPTSGPRIVNQAGPYIYQGCYTEATDARALIGNESYSTLMTIEMCASNCPGWTYMGVEYGTECYCGDSISAGSVKATNQADCNFACPGNSTELCGAGDRLEMYMKGTGTTPQALFKIAGDANNSVTSLVSPSMILGTGARSGFFSSANTLPASSNSTKTSPPSSIFLGTVASSTAIIRLTTSSGGYKAATAETSGSSSSSDHSISSSVLDLKTTKSPRLTLLSSSSSLLVSTSPIKGLPGSTAKLSQSSSSSSSLSSVSSAHSLEEITSTSSSSSSKLLASPLLTTTSASRSKSPSTLSSDSLSASASTTKLAAASSSQSPITKISSPSSAFTRDPSSTTPSSSTISLSTLIPTPSQIVGSFAYLGCANTTEPLALNGASFTNSTGMTQSACQKFCIESNYGLAATQAGSKCFCGNGLQSYSSVDQKNGACSTACSGNFSEICGSKSYLSVWNATAGAKIPPTTVKQVGIFTSKGCFDTAHGLNGTSYSNSTAMTVESCVMFCERKGYNNAALGNGVDCSCGAAAPPKPATRALDQCNVLCVGNRREFCGADGRISLYQKDPGSMNSDGTPISINTENKATIKAVAPL
ncbi:MAG: hypothetical protein M4579_003660 [Chaenotheca gracillima]|nr:MAG: hypothetical protein M4579_003660 [Chaenotheca gracillima]